MKKSTLEKILKATTSIFTCAIIIGNVNILLPQENPNDSIAIETSCTNLINESPETELSPLGDEKPFTDDSE